MIDKGFTEKQIDNDFSELTINRYQVYLNEQIKAKNNAQRRGSNLERSGSRIRTRPKSAW